MRFRNEQTFVDAQKYGIKRVDVKTSTVVSELSLFVLGYFKIGGTLKTQRLRSEYNIINGNTKAFVGRVFGKLRSGIPVRIREKIAL